MTHPNKPLYRNDRTGAGLHDPSAIRSISLCVIAAISSTAFCADMHLPSTPAEILSASRGVFSDASKRQAFTSQYVASRKSAWFADFQVSVADFMDFEKKSTPVQSLMQTKPRFLRVDQLAEPGDVIVIEWDPQFDGDPLSNSQKVVAVYVGEESFPDIPGRTFSFFIYPYRSRLEYNTIPARIHDQYLQATVNKEYPKADLEKLPWDEKRAVRWARPPLPRLTMRTKMASPTAMLTLYRVQGKYSGFPPQEQADVGSALLRALSLNQMCVDALANPTPRTIELLEMTFSIPTGPDQGQHVEKIRQNFLSNQAVLESQQLRFRRRSDTESEALSFVAATDSVRRIVYIGKQFFATNYKAVHGDRPFEQASTVLHEAIHVVHPISESEAGPSHGGHWGGLPNYQEIDQPKSLGISFGDAIRNPYCYQYFAIWRKLSTEP